MAGKVYLVGAGPGDYKLITVKGKELLKRADVLVYDRLINSRYLNDVKAACEKIYVGKKADHHMLPQAQINEILIKKAAEGKVVVRLKGGDPYVFGRGAEEAESLVAAGLEVEVVPGVTSAIGGLAYAGIPVTHREYASSFHVISAHRQKDRELDYNTLSALTGTLVFLMGSKRLGIISEGLINAGKDPDTPVALVHSASTPNQQVVLTNLEEMSEHQLTSPLLVAVGEVANLTSELNFLTKKPLFGKRIAITRAQKQSKGLQDRLEDLGAEVLSVPTIEIFPKMNQEPLKAEINQLDVYDWLIFTSANAVQVFFDVLNSMDKDSRSLGGVKVAVIGKMTANALTPFGIKADLISEVATLEGLAEALKDEVNADARILLPKAEDARDVLSHELEAALTEVIIYESRIDESAKVIFSQALVTKGFDYITFTASSTVKNLLKLVSAESLSALKATQSVSLGPITSSTLKEVGFNQVLESKEATIDALVDVLLNHVKGCELNDPKA